MELYFHDFSFVPLFMQVRVNQDRDRDRADLVGTLSQDELGKNAERGWTNEGSERSGTYQ